MGRLFIFFLLVSGVFCAQAQDRQASPMSSAVTLPVAKPEVIEFAQLEYDFGKIPQGRPVTHTFTFRNTGNEPIAISDVHASCGCTTPEWSKDSVGAGEHATIQVGFNAATEGAFVKPIFITYNDGETRQLIIKGDVWKTPAYSAPENTLVNKLNKKQ